MSIARLNTKPTVYAGGNRLFCSPTLPVGNDPNDDVGAPGTGDIGTSGTPFAVGNDVAATSLSRR